MIENKKIRRKRRSNSECLAELIDTMLNSPMSKLTSADRIEAVVFDLRAVIDELDRNFTSAKSLILRLARLLDETKQISKLGCSVLERYSSRGCYQICISEISEIYRQR